MLAFECRMVPTVASVGGWWSREHTGLEAASLPTCAALCGSAGSTGHMEHGDCWRDLGARACGQSSGEGMGPVLCPQPHHCHLQTQG